MSLLFRTTTARLLSSTSLSSSIHKNAPNELLNSASSLPLFAGVIRKPNQRFMRAVALVGATHQLKNSYNQQTTLEKEQVRQFSSLRSQMLQPPTMARLIHNVQYIFAVSICMQQHVTSDCESVLPLYFN